MKISVVIPIYKGIQYIKKQILQIEQAAIEAKKSSIEIELVFVNDYPECSIDTDLKSEIITIVVINTDENCGIQKARIKGINASTGEYIHMLDQDDEIDSSFYFSQMENIAESDGVYCRCYNGNRQSYNYDRIFEGAFSSKRIFKACPVISPGQVVVKKHRISDFWKKNILDNSGSDDYYLWLCMYAEGCTFSENQEILYTHVVNGENYSSDAARSKKSDEEMVRLLLSSGLFNEFEKKELIQIPERQFRRHYEPQRKDQIVLRVLSELLECYEYNICLDKYFINKGIKSIAIYGAAVMGERINGLMSGGMVDVTCFIDKNAPFIKEKIPVYKPDDYKLDSEAILISMISNEDKVIPVLKERFEIPIFTIREVVREMTYEKTCRCV